MSKTFLDRSSGEIIQEPDFVKVYIKDLCAIKGLSGVQYKMFTFLIGNMNYHNEVSFGPTAKKRFMEDEGIKNQTFNNNISAIILANLIERIGRGEFRVNKRYAVKVEWSKVQSIVWTTKYNRSGPVDSVVFDDGTAKIKVVQ